MSAACTIDGTDIATLGMFILRGGDSDFIVLPEQKQPESNEWPEHSGKEYDLSSPVFKARDVTVNYYLMGNETTFKPRLNAFLNLHHQSGYREIFVRAFDRAFNLRFVEVSDYQQNRGFSIRGEKNAHLSVKYMMDDPIQHLDNTVSIPISSAARAYVAVNDYDLSEFGIISRGVYASAIRRKVKDPLLMTSNYLSGMTADISANPVREDTAIAIKCTMIAPDLTTFWTNYNALWHHLSAGELILSLTAAGKNFRCWYKSMSNFDKPQAFTNRVLVRFTLNMVAYVPVSYLLATESGALITTEDGKFFINMNHRGYNI